MEAINRFLDNNPILRQISSLLICIAAAVNEYLKAKGVAAVNVNRDISK